MVISPRQVGTQQQLGGGEAEGNVTGHGTLCVLILWGTRVEEVGRVLRNKILGINGGTGTIDLGAIPEPEVKLQALAPR